MHEISNNVVCATSKVSDQSLCYSLEYSMDVKLLIKYHLEFLSLKGDCLGSYESTLVKLLEISCRVSYFKFKISNGLISVPG